MAWRVLHQGEVLAAFEDQDRAEEEKQHLVEAHGYEAAGLRVEEEPMSFVELYQDTAGEWRWRRKSPNGRIVADGAEGYTRKDDAREAAVRENPDLEIRED